MVKKGGKEKGKENGEEKVEQKDEEKRKGAKNKEKKKEEKPSLINPLPESTSLPGTTCKHWGYGWPMIGIQNISDEN